MCGGQNVAQMLLRISLAAIARNFDLAPAVGTDEKSMEVKDSFVSWLYCYRLRTLPIMYANAFL